MSDHKFANLIQMFKYFGVVGHESINLEGLQFDLIKIKAATDNFSHENKIGKGGFGEVHKGILCDGRRVAVKRLSTSSKQGGQQQKLSWLERYKIIKGIAMGILYLHEHSRLKILAWLELLKLIKILEILIELLEHSNGYMSPEYAMLGQFSEKSDIFSFGVMILEIITGKRSVNAYESHNVVEGLMGYVWRQWKDQEPLSILDSNIKERYSQMEVLRCIHIGLLCVQENLNDRPTITTIISYFNNHSLELPSPQEPAFLLHRRRMDPEIVIQQESSLSQAANGSVLFSINEMSASDFYPR
ncbi:Putative cysteine-rich receptor-like protein kinase 31 [Glycine soja]|uniref:Putative cysteine-rich receptor-like protein kinase 31 n=1 Tax=Glycine soja TaxID=3848 RepID=A0A0B2NWM3_GLYSO|nr:Putative cysteine-rich receptor-like protein kinase 31 [Glycine soja]